MLKTIYVLSFIVLNTYLTIEYEYKFLCLLKNNLWLYKLRVYRVYGGARKRTGET